MYGKPPIRKTKKGIREESVIIISKEDYESILGKPSNRPNFKSKPLESSKRDGIQLEKYIKDSKPIPNIIPPRYSKSYKNI